MEIEFEIFPGRIGGMGSAWGRDGEDEEGERGRGKKDTGKHSTKKERDGR